MKFIVIVWAAFLARVNPVSTIAKPACMNITRNPATSVHTKLMATVFAAAAALAAWASESAAGTTGVIGSPEQGWNGYTGVSEFVHNMHDSIDMPLLPDRVGCSDDV